MVTLEEMKQYLRVDSSDEDDLIRALMLVSKQLCLDVTRMTDWKELEDKPYVKIAVMYAVAYLYEHREEANHQKLMLDLRAILFGVRKEGF
jgi:uncharacterized phage protein (predicted DNA packaging)